MSFKLTREGLLAAHEVDGRKRAHSNGFSNILELLGVDLEELEVVGLSEDLQFREEDFAGPAPPK